MYLFWARLLTRQDKFAEALEKLDLASVQLQEKVLEFIRVYASN